MKMLLTNVMCRLCFYNAHSIKEWKEHARLHYQKEKIHFQIYDVQVDLADVVDLDECNSVF